MNLTETRQLRELEDLGDVHVALTNTPHQQQQQSASEQDLKVLHDTVSLTDKIEPIMQKIIGGIGRMGKVVGSSTETSQVTPDLLAAAVEVK